MTDTFQENVFSSVSHSTEPRLPSNAVLSSTMIMNVLTASLVGLYALYCLLYWRIKGIPSLSLKSFCLSPFYLIDGLTVAKYTSMIENYQEMNSKGHKYAGVVTSIRSVLIVKDLGVIHDLLVKRHFHFDDKGFFSTDMYGPQVGIIVNLKGMQWRKMRSILSPDALCDRLKPLFKSVLDISAYLVEAIEDCASENVDIDVKELFSCFTTDVITYHCYKVNCYSYRRSDEEFCKCQSDRLYPLGLTAEGKVSRKLYYTIRKFMAYRELGDYKHLDFFSLDFFMNDWSLDKEEPLPLFQMANRVHLFFYHSFDISSTTLNFAVYELCRNPHIQEKVREEINKVLARHGGEITWRNLRYMKYLDQIIDETLRLYPPAANLVKRCAMKGCKLKGTDVNISSTTDVVVPLFCLHRDPRYFPDPEKFDPQRFDQNEITKNPTFFMPYGEGPKEYKSIQACMVQTKVGLVQILRNFRLSISSKTHLPLRLQPRTFLESEDVLYVNAEKI